MGVALVNVLVIFIGYLILILGERDEENFLFGWVFGFWIG